jgi:hypothetical protein
MAAEKVGVKKSGLTDIGLPECVQGAANTVELSAFAQQVNQRLGEDQNGIIGGT